MAKSLIHIKLFPNLYSLQNIFLFTLLFTLNQIPRLNCDNVCTVNSLIKLEGDSCFNGVMQIFARCGQFSVRKDGALLVEFSDGTHRYFFGLRKNGRGAFQNEDILMDLNPIKKAKLDGQTEATIDARYESKNMLVYLRNDTEQNNPYIFSTSSYIALAELHYFDEDFNLSHETWKTTDFFGIFNESRYIFSYQFSLFEGSNNVYYAAYVQYKGTYKIEYKNEWGNVYKTEDKDYSVSYTLSKFNFTSANECQTPLTIEFPNNFDNRIVCGFIYEKYNYLAVVFLHSDTPLKYKMRLHNLNTLAQEKEVHIDNYGIDSDDDSKGMGVYFKAFYLWQEFFAMVYFGYNYENGTPKIRLKLRIFELNKNNDNNYWTKVRNQNDFGYNLDSNIKNNEFYKIDVDHFIIITTESTNTEKKLYIIFIDMFDWYHYMNVRTYKYNLDNYYFRGAPRGVRW